MKVISLLFSLSLLPSLMAQDTLFYAHFNAGITSEWTQAKLDTMQVKAQHNGFANGWNSRDTEVFGDRCAASCSDFDPAGEANRWLITPILNLGTERTVLYWRSRSLDPSYPEDYSVYISDTDNDPASFVALSEFLQQGPTWTTHEIDLSQENITGNQFYLAFVHQSEDAYFLEIDDVLLRDEAPLSIKEESLKQVQLLSNPVQEVLRISTTENFDLKVYGLDGKHFSLPQEKNELNTSSLPAGMYILQYSNVQQIGQLRFIKR
ncbi:MAG: T9SS type A sorting domain-containing protein [Bacteroidetes bacterium]|nr:MAG: T9SS type A sorting domain-containing protein [Bacteroidota bacterium]